MEMYWLQKYSVKDNLGENAIAVYYGHSIGTAIIMQIMNHQQWAAILENGAIRAAFMLIYFLKINTNNTLCLCSAN